MEQIVSYNVIYNILINLLINPLIHFLLLDNASVAKHFATQRFPSLSPAEVLVEL